MNTATAPGLDRPAMTPEAHALAAGIRTWIECESPSNDPAAVHKMAQIVVAKAKDAGLTVTLSEIGPTKIPLIHATNRARGDTRPGLLLLAQLVPDEEVGSHASRVLIEAFAKRTIYILVLEPARPNGGRCVTGRKDTGMLKPFATEAG